MTVGWSLQSRTAKYSDWATYVKKKAMTEAQRNFSKSSGAPTTYEKPCRVVDSQYSFAVLLICRG